jgi:hypothetical protein
MFSEQFKKILNLIKKTGDRMIVFDPEAPDSSYVVMDFDRYAGTMTGEDLVNKKLVANNLPDVKDFTDNNQTPVKNIDKGENLTEEDLTDKINREISIWKNRDDLAFLSEENKPKKAWQIPPTVKDKAQEVQ